MSTSSTCRDNKIDYVCTAVRFAMDQLQRRRNRGETRGGGGGGGGGTARYRNTYTSTSLRALCNTVTV